MDSNQELEKNGDAQINSEQKISKNVMEPKSEQGFVVKSASVVASGVFNLGSSTFCAGVSGVLWAGKIASSGVIKGTSSLVGTVSSVVSAGASVVASGATAARSMVISSDSKEHSD